MARGASMASDTIRQATRHIPTGRGAHDVRKRVTAMEHLLERTIKIPGTNQTLGLDVLLDFIPVGGSFIGAILGLYMVWEARNIGMSKFAMTKMVGNVGIDWLLGLVPGIGIIPDFFFRSNSRNLRMIRKHLDRHHPSTATIQH